MFNRNSGSNEHDILQNQFTSYLSFAVSNARIDFIRAKIARLKKEQVTDQYELIFAQDSFEIEAFLENEILVQAIWDIREKERYVFLARVFQGDCPRTRYGRKRRCGNLLPYSEKIAGYAGKG